MIAMALYLLRNRIQSHHGKLLLIFVMVFLGDLTFYQVRLSGMHQLAGNIATAVYMVLAAIKFYVVVRFLDLKIYSSRILFVFSAFTIIWIGPKIAYFMVDSVGSNSISFFDGSYIFYSLWLVAGLIHLPLIAENWKKNTISDHDENSYLGNETPFWRWLIIFPFILMPVQIFINVMADSYNFMDKSMPLPALFLPWAVCAAFFVQTLWRSKVEEYIGLKPFDSIVMLVALAAVISFSSTFTVPGVINNLLVVVGLCLTWLTRENPVNGAALGIVVLVHTGAQLKTVAQAAVDFGSGLSRTAWAAILMLGSFVMLGLGFVLSVGHSAKEDDKTEVSEE
jgi:hypothetical protein